MPEKLKGDKAGITSLRVDYQYRMELKIEVTKSENGDDIITILEVSNHYGD
nr:MAG TPA: Killer protein TOXINS, BIOFILMS, CELL METABOLISM.25A [Caudoviricetes sp.]